MYQYVGCGRLTKGLVLVQHVVRRRFPLPAVPGWLGWVECVEWAGEWVGVVVGGWWMGVLSRYAFLLACTGPAGDFVVSTDAAAYLLITCTHTRACLCPIYNPNSNPNLAGASPPSFHASRILYVTMIHTACI